MFVSMYTHMHVCVYTWGMAHISLSMCTGVDTRVYTQTCVCTYNALVEKWEHECLFIRVGTGVSVWN